MSKEKKDRTVAAFGTLLIHGLVAIVLLLMAFRTPSPTGNDKEGVEVDLGFYNQGMGIKQPEKPAAPKQTVPEKPKPNKVEKDIVTQNDEETPSLEKTKKAEPKKEKPEEVPQPTVNKRALMPRQNESKDGDSQGNSEAPGDQGKPNGLENIQKYDGTTPDGINYDLGGRGHKYLMREKIDDLPDQGTIVVDIWVDPNGNVIRATAGAKGTTTRNAVLMQKAEKYALASKFTSKADAPAEQHGTITYKFVIK